MITTYVIILGFASSINTYFWEPQNYGYDNTVMMSALGVVVIFKIAEPLIYSGAIGCLGGLILSSEVKYFISIVNDAFQLFSHSLFCANSLLHCAFTLLAFNVYGIRLCHSSNIFV